MSITNLTEKIVTQPDPEGALRELLTHLIHHCSKSRLQIAEEMSVRASLPITKLMLDNWTALSKKGTRFPASLITVFCEVIGCDDLQRWAAGPRLRKLIQFGEWELELEERRAELLRSDARRKT